MDDGMMPSDAAFYAALHQSEKRRLWRNSAVLALGLAVSSGMLVAALRDIAEIPAARGAADLLIFTTVGFLVLVAMDQWDRVANTGQWYSMREYKRKARELQGNEDA